MATWTTAGVVDATLKRARRDSHGLCVGAVRLPGVNESKRNAAQQGDVFPRRTECRWAPVVVPDGEAWPPHPLPFVAISAEATGCTAEKRSLQNNRGVGPRYVRALHPPGHLRRSRPLFPITAEYGHRIDPRSRGESNVVGDSDAVPLTGALGVLCGIAEI